MTVLKILLSHLQILSLNSSYGIDWPPLVVTMMSVFDLIGYIDALFPLDCGLRGSDYFGRTSAYLLLPFLYIPVASICIYIKDTFFVKMKRKKSTSIVPTISDKTDSGTSIVSEDTSEITFRLRFEAIVIISSLILYPSLSKRALSIFSCRGIYMFHPETFEDVKTYYLAADTSELCYTNRHVMWALTVGVPSVCLYVIGIPLGCAVQLWRNQKQIFIPKLEHIHIRTKAVYGFLFRSYEADWYWWETVRISRKTIMIVIAVFLRSVGKRNHVLLSLGVMAFSFSIHQHAMPFENDDLDMLEKYALVCQFLTLYSGLFFDSNETISTTKTIFTYVILLPNGIFALVCIGIYIKNEKIFHKFKWKRSKKHTNDIRMKAKNKLNAVVARQKNGKHAVQTFRKRKDGHHSYDEASYLPLLQQRWGQAPVDGMRNM